MKIKDTGDLIEFDAFPNRYNPQQRIILTHLLHLDKQILPERLCPIITSKYLAKQFKEHCKQKGAKCYNTLQIEEMEPYTFRDIALPGRRALQILLCESKEATRNLMAVIREDGQLKCIYAGNFLDIRTAVFHDIFASWIERETVPHIYLNLKRSQEDDRKHDVDLMFQVFTVVARILECHESQLVLHMYLPQFGYDHFIYQLACKFPKRVMLTCDFKSSLNPIIQSQTLEFSSECLQKAKIILLPGQPPAKRVTICPYTKRETITLNIQEKPKNMNDVYVNPEKYLYNLYYTPEPSPFQLQLLCLVLKPKRLFGIIDGFNINSKVPSYLVELCSNATSTGENKKKSRFSGTLRSLAEVKETGKASKPVLSYGPQMTNVNQAKDLYFYDSSESD